MEYFSLDFQMHPYDPGWVRGVECFIDCGKNVTMQPVHTSTPSPGPDSDHRFRLILPSVLDDPDRLIRVEVFLAFGAMLLQDLLVHLYSNAWASRNLRMTILDL